MSKYSNHKIYKNREGIEVPSVTTILKILNKPSIISWANMLGFRRIKYEEELNRSALRGTTIHNLIDAFLNKKTIKFKDIKNPILSKKDMLLYMDKFINWYKGIELGEFFTEKSFEGLKYGGTIDFFGEVDGENTIIDFKTSKKIRLTMFIQLALYIKLLEDEGKVVHRAGILRVNRDEYEFKSLSRAEMDKYLDMGLKLVDLFYIYEDINKEWGDKIV